MSSNAERVRRWYRDVWRPGGEATVQELMAEGVEGHMEGAEVMSRADFLAERQRMLDVFPDLSIVIDDLVEQGDTVAVRWHVNGTHLGGGLGLAASKRPVAFRGMTFMEFRDGQIVRGWDSWNLGGLLQTLTAP